MIKYDEGRWSIWFAMRMEGSVVDRATALALPCAIVSMLFHYLLVSHPVLREQLKEDVGSNVHQGFTFVLGFLIVFRTQKAYSRWWEGGTLLQQLRGDWFNAFSNLMAFLNQDDKDEGMQQEVTLLQHKLVRLFSLLYGSALRQVNTVQGAKIEYLNFRGFNRKAMEMLDADDTNDSCELVLQWIQRLIVEANTANVIKIAPPILARVYNQLGQGIVKLNNARKIRDFPVPFSLAQLIAIMLILHWLATAVACAVQLSNIFASGLTSFIVCFSFWGVNYIAVELENPYGDDPNDLPLLEMQQDMNRSLISLLQEGRSRPPEFVMDESHKDFSCLWTECEEVSVESYTSHLTFPDSETMAAAPTAAKGNHLPMPHVDSCADGNCNQGKADVGVATDSSYRDSFIEDGRDSSCPLPPLPLGPGMRQPPAATLGNPTHSAGREAAAPSRRPSSPGGGGGNSLRPSDGGAVGKQHPPADPASPANSLTALLPAQRTGGLGQLNRGGAARRPATDCRGRLSDLSFSPASSRTNNLFAGQHTHSPSQSSSLRAAGASSSLFTAAGALCSAAPAPAARQQGGRQRAARPGGDVEAAADASSSGAGGRAWHRE